MPYFYRTTAIQVTKILKRCSSNSSKQQQKSLIKNAELYFRDLKVRVVQSLTDSMPPDEREQLIKSIGPGYVERKSVGEAVAAALAKEQDFRTEWVEKVEQAAVERIEMEQRLRSAAEEKVVQMLENVTKVTTDEGEHAMSDVIVEEDEESTHISDNQKLDSISHPVLGELIVDLGYKRVYLTNAHNLSAISIWEKQRAYRHARAKLIAQEKLKRKDIGLPGVITLFEDKGGNLSVLDGQHRVGMLTILNSMNLKKGDGLLFDLDKILVEVFPDTSKGDGHLFASDLFSDINKAEPVKLIDMPGEADRDILRIINPVAETIEDMYPDMFKANVRCLPPHLNVDNFRSMLYNGDIMKRYDVNDEEQLLKWILEKNDAMRERYCQVIEASDKGLEHDHPQDSLDPPRKYSKRVLNKAADKGFFLGLDNTWLY